MKSIILFIMGLVGCIFSQTVTVYTEGRIYANIDPNGVSTPLGSTMEDRSRWIIDTESMVFIHNTNTGEVRESTYWMDKSTFEVDGEGFTVIATSDAGNTRRYYFFPNMIFIVLNVRDDDSKDIVIFKVKNSN